MINPVVEPLAQRIGFVGACALLGRSRAGHYRAKNPAPVPARARRASPANALTADEQAEVLAVLTSARFADNVAHVQP
ncbi:MAG: hypothetical protein WBB15_15570 [Ornithinimicrobium sp.]